MSGSIKVASFLSLDAANAIVFSSHGCYHLVSRCRVCASASSVRVQPIHVVLAFTFLPATSAALR
eukprot:1880094-Amphidinium_carterae.1